MNGSIRGVVWSQQLHAMAKVMTDRFGIRTRDFRYVDEDSLEYCLVSYY